MKTKRIYKYLPGRYAKLKSFSDYGKNTIRSIAQIVPICNKTIVELGTGTGNIALQLAEHAEKVCGFDNSKAMLRFAKKACKSKGIENCIFDFAEHKKIPLCADFADMIVIGWALVGYVSEGLADDTWREKIGLLLHECQRLLKPNGYVLILETANLVNELPFGDVYHPIRKRFLSYLEDEFQFHAEFYSNDWDFLHLRNVKWAKFWFGDKIIGKMICSNRTKMEECVGIWWKQYS